MFMIGFNIPKANTHSHAYFIVDSFDRWDFSIFFYLTYEWKKNWRIGRTHTLLFSAKCRWANAMKNETWAEFCSYCCFELSQPTQRAMYGKIWIIKNKNNAKREANKTQRHKLSISIWASQSGIAAGGRRMHYSGLGDCVSVCVFFLKYFSLKFSTRFVDTKLLSFLLTPFCSFDCLSICTSIHSSFASFCLGCRIIQNVWLRFLIFHRSPSPHSNRNKEIWLLSKL